MPGELGLAIRRVLCKIRRKTCKPHIRGCTSPRGRGRRVLGSHVARSDTTQCELPVLASSRCPRQSRAELTTALPGLPAPFLNLVSQTLGGGRRGQSAFSGVRKGRPFMRRRANQARGVPAARFHVSQRSHFTLKASLFLRQLREPGVPISRHGQAAHHLTEY